MNPRTQSMRQGESGRHISPLLFWVVVTVLLLEIPAFAVSNKGECDYFSEVRQNQNTRRSFAAHFNYARSLPLMLFGDFKRKNDHLFKPYTVQGRTFMLDRMTVGCLECHDDMLSVAHKKGEDILDKNFHSALGKHAIGLDYHDLVLQKPTTFFKPDPNASNVVFVGGKLGCISCHNPVSTLPFHLNASETDNALCRECHRR